MTTHQTLDIGSLQRLKIRCISETGWFDTATVFDDIKVAGGAAIDQYTIPWPPFGSLHPDNAAGFSALLETEATDGTIRRLLFDTGWNPAWMDRRFAEEGVDLLPANLELSAMEYNLMNAMSRETTLRNYLSQVKDRYDFVLIDCMPSLSMVTLNALSAADSVIIPVQAQYLPAKGMTQLVQTISKVKKYINQDIKIDGMLLTLVDNRTNLAKSTVEALRENFGNQIKLYRTSIPIAVKAAETSSKGKSIFAYEPNSTVSKAYAEFTKEVLADGRKKERLHSHEAR